MKSRMTVLLMIVSSITIITMGCSQDVWSDKTRALPDMLRQVPEGMETFDFDNVHL